MPQRDLPGTRALLRLQVGALLVAAAALGLRWGLADRGETLPPGLLLLGAAAATLLVRPGGPTVTAGVLVAALVATVLVSDAGPGFFTGAGGAVRGVLRWLELVALTAASAAGAGRLVRGRPAPWGRYAQVAVLLGLAPVAAEYLAAYDDSTGDARRLIGGLIVLAPLYGCPALLIREVVRRTGRGWPSILLLATAFGLLQAGVVDQSLFSTDYRQIEGWEESRATTLLAPLGISAASALNFLSGHAVYSIAAPIGTVEGFRRSDATRPWLRTPGLVVVALAWVAASWLVLRDSLATETSHASPAQAVAASGLAVGLVVLGLRLPRVAVRTGGPRPNRAAPAVPLVLLGSAALSVVYGTAPETWTGVGSMAGALLVAGVGLALGSQRSGWGVRHVAAAAVAPLVVRAALAFGYQPLVGEVSPAAALGHHVVMLVLTLALLVLVLRPGRPAAGRLVAG